MVNTSLAAHINKSQRLSYFPFKRSMTTKLYTYGKESLKIKPIEPLQD